MDSKELLKEIVRCKNVKDCLIAKNSKNPCYDIVCNQGVKKLSDFQVPEPWSGDLENAKILFISSNPSISISEKYPVWRCADEKIAHFFTNRFNGEKGFIKNGTKHLQKDGNYSKCVNYWSFIRRRAEELLDRQAIPGVDYSLTEVVHCKSKEEYGIYKSVIKLCSASYLNRIVYKSGARVIIVLGAVAKNAVGSCFKIPERERICQIVIGNRMVSFLFIPHANARVPRTLKKIISRNEMQRLKIELEVHVPN